MPGYLDSYGAGEDRRNRIAIRAAAAILSISLFGSLGWYLLKNHHQEGVVKDFIAALRSGDLPSAYRIWGCTPQKPCSGYDFRKFSGDWGPAGVSKPGDTPDLNVLALSDSQSCNNGVLLTLEVNSGRTEKLWVDKSSDAIGYAPYPICPHKSPWSIMLHRTVGRLRKPLLH
jgi:hypothetical protein